MLWLARTLGEVFAWVMSWPPAGHRRGARRNHRQVHELVRFLRSTQLSRKFGSWPPTSFKLMKNAWQADFWKRLDDQRYADADSLQAHVIEEICLCRRERTRQTRGGEYLPLKVWD